LQYSRHFLAWPAFRPPKVIAARIAQFKGKIALIVSLP